MKQNIIEEHYSLENEEIKEEVREEYEELRVSINTLTHKIGYLFSYHQSFFRGVVQGVGITIGSGIVFVLLSALLYQVFSYLGFGTSMRSFFPVQDFPKQMNQIIQTKE